MLVKLTQQETRILHQLVRTPLWLEFDKLLERELQTIYANLVAHPDTVGLHELRGRAKQIRELRTLASQTAETLERYEK